MADFRLSGTTIAIMQVLQVLQNEPRKNFPLIVLEKQQD